MSKSVKKESKNSFHTLLPAVIAGVIVAAIFIFMLTPTQPPNKQALTTRCMINLRGLFTYLHDYTEGHEGKFPPPAQWCDVLVKEFEGDSGFKKDLFQCPGVEAGPCNYTMNPNADPNGSGGIVLLFESKPGWNQAGGLELLTTENHMGKGCCVLFTDWHVEFIKSDRVGQLKWSDEKGDVN